MKSTLAHLPFDCLFDISSFLGLGSVRSLLLTNSSLHSQLTVSHDSKFIWMTQLNYFLIAEIEFLEMTGKSKKYNKNWKEIRRLNSQLKDQKRLLKRFGSAMQQKNEEQSGPETRNQEDKGEVDEALYTTFSIYNTVKQLYLCKVVRRLRSQMNDIVERMKVAKSIKMSIELFEEAVKNNDLSMFKSGVVLESEEELKRIEQQESLLWSIRSRSKTFLFYFLNSVLEGKEDLANSEDGVSLVQRIIHILEQLVNKFRLSATEIHDDMTLLLFAIKIRNLDILRAFIPLYNQSIVQDHSAQKIMLFDPKKMREDALMYLLPLSMAIKEFVRTDLIDLILEEVYEPNRKEMISAVLNSRQRYRDYQNYSILDYKLSWIKSMIDKYQIDVSMLSDQVFCSAARSNSSSTPYELIQYFCLQGLRMRNGQLAENYNHLHDPFMSVLRKYGIKEEQEAMECMELLLGAGGELSQLPLFDTFMYDGFSFEVYQFLTKHGANVNLVGHLEFPPLLNLISAASYTENSLKKMGWLLKCGADPTLFFRSNNYHYQNCNMSALRLTYHRLARGDPDLFDGITMLLAEYGVTRETEA